jgi:hypothetical protein
MDTRVIKTTYDHGDMEIDVEVHLSLEWGNVYRYGDDYDGNRGEDRQDLDNISVEEVIVLNAADLPLSLVEEIEAYFQDLGGEYWRDYL